MFHRSPSRPFLMIALLVSGLLLPAMGQQPQPDAVPKEREEKKLLRLVCVSSLEKEQEVILASRNDKGEWQEFGAVKLRPSFITDWLPAGAGELHLALREGKGLKSICQFKHPASARRSLVVLIADPQKGNYKADVIDPKILEFGKGSVMIVNYTSLPGMVLLGSLKVSVKSGQRVVAKPVVDDKGMYRMMAAYLGADQKLVPCYDRFVPANPDSRDMMFLFPDPTLGFKVFSLPMFGDLE